MTTTYQKLQTKLEAFNKELPKEKHLCKIYIIPTLSSTQIIYISNNKKVRTSVGCHEIETNVCLYIDNTKDFKKLIEINKLDGKIKISQENNQIFVNKIKVNFMYETEETLNTYNLDSYKKKDIIDFSNFTKCTYKKSAYVDNLTNYYYLYTNYIYHTDRYKIIAKKTNNLSQAYSLSVDALNSIKDIKNNYNCILENKIDNNLVFYSENPLDIATFIDIDNNQDKIIPTINSIVQLLTNLENNNKHFELEKEQIDQLKIDIAVSKIENKSEIALQVIDSDNQKENILLKLNYIEDIINSYQLTNKFYFKKNLLVIDNNQNLYLYSPVKQ